MSDMGVKRIAFKMVLKPDVVGEYKKRHDMIWPELKLLLKEHGIGNYSIFLDSDNKTLFAVQDQADFFEEKDLKQHPIMRKWWEYMCDLMEVEVDCSPKTILLDEIFYLP